MTTLLANVCLCCVAFSEGAIMSSHLSAEELEEIREGFQKVGEWAVCRAEDAAQTETMFDRAVSSCCPPEDVDGNGYICASELSNLFQEVGCPVAGYKVRELLQTLDKDKDSHISFEEFTAVGNTNKPTNQSTN